MNLTNQLYQALVLCYDHCRLYHPEVETNNVGKTVREALTAYKSATWTEWLERLNDDELVIMLDAFPEMKAHLKRILGISND